MTTPTLSLFDGFDVLDAPHEQAVFALGKMAALVARLQTQAADATTRELAREVIEFFDRHASEHHADEEKHVFPRLLREGDADTIERVQRLQQDHHWLDQDWSELRPQLQAIGAGNGWVDVDVLREQTLVFTSLMRDHIALEESCIYPRAREGLAMRARLEMGREMAGRRRAACGNHAVKRAPGTAGAAQVDSLRAMLLARHRQLQTRLAAAEQARRPAPHAAEVADRKDDAERQQHDDLDEAQLMLERAELEQVEMALHRWSDGDYGRCKDCGDPIGSARLRAQPSATRCAGCQALHESRTRDARSRAKS